MKAILASLVLAVSSASQAFGAAPCRLEMVDSLDLGSSMTIPVKIDGNDARMEIDTGAHMPSLGKSWVDAFKLKEHDAGSGNGATTYFGGHMGSFVVIDKLQAGKFETRAAPAFVDPGWDRTDAAGLLGTQFLAQFDVEFDFAAHKMNLFQQDHCPGAFVHWTEAPIAAIAFDSDASDHILVKVMLDGHALKSGIDTGAGVAVIGLGTARSVFGIGLDTPGMEYLKTVNGHRMYRYPFKSLALGGVVLAEPAIVVDADDGGQPGRPDLLFGATLLTSLHLFVSYKEKMLYATTADAH